MIHSYGDSCVHDYESIEDIMNWEQWNVDGGGNKKVSCHQYYCYKLQIKDDKSLLLHSRQLLQQYIVDISIKLERTRLDYCQGQQSKIIMELYQGIINSVLVGESRASKVGNKIVLPASFIGDPKDMRHQYLDAISLVQ